MSLTYLNKAIFVFVVTMILPGSMVSAQQQTGTAAQTTDNPQNLTQSLQGASYNAQQNVKQVDLFNSSDLTISSAPAAALNDTTKESIAKINTDKTILWLVLTLVGGLSLATSLMVVAAKSQKQHKTTEQVAQNANVSATLVASRKVHGERKRRSKTTRRQRRPQSR